MDADSSSEVLKRRRRTCHTPDEFGNHPPHRLAQRRRARCKRKDAALSSSDIPLGSPSYHTGRSTTHCSRARLITPRRYSRGSFLRCDLPTGRAAVSSLTILAARTRTPTGWAFSIPSASLSTHAAARSTSQCARSAAGSSRSSQIFPARRKSASAPSLSRRNARALPRCKYARATISDFCASHSPALVATTSV